MFGKVPVNYCFQVQAPTKSFFVWCSSKAERDSWVKALVQHISAVRTKFELENCDVAPVWIPDSVCKACYKCKASFSVFRRRHHCRRCGQVFCNNCTKLRSKVEIIGEKQTRVCDSCHVDISQGKSFLRRPSMTPFSKDGCPGKKVESEDKANARRKRSSLRMSMGEGDGVDAIIAQHEHLALPVLPIRPISMSSTGSVLSGDSNMSGSGGGEQ
jgi:hypothetical protein